MPLIAPCEEFSDRPAFTCMGQTLSFTDMELLSRQFGCYLLDHCGLVPGDRVAVQLPNISQYPISIWGILRAGLVVVNTNPMYTAREQLHQFNDSGAKALVVLSDLLPVTEQVIPQTGVETVIATSATDLLQAQSLPDSSLSNLVAFNDALALGADKQLPERTWRPWLRWRCCNTPAVPPDPPRGRFCQSRQCLWRRAHVQAE